MAKDYLDDMSIDAILNDVKRLTGEDTEDQKIWSLDEIDALLADDEGEDTVTESISSVIEEINSFEMAEEPKLEVQEEEISEKANEVICESAVESTEETEAEKEELKPEKSDLGLGLKEFAMNNVIDEEDDAPVKKHSKWLTPSADEKEDDTPDEMTQDEKEVEPLLSTTTAIDELQDEEQSEEETKEEKQPEVPGQISIEKTRVFNEVEARAVRNDKIQHHIGENKILRTGELPKYGGMETDPYRERFLNKPKLDIEKTQDHREMLKDLPAKTIEKHGVVVKKPATEKTSSDGLSPVPILVDASDEYDAQHKLEIEAQAGEMKSNSFDDDNQIVLEGFNEDEDVVIVNEAEEEAKLRRIRKDKASKFKLFPNLDADDTDIYSETEEASQVDEYEQEKTRPVTVEDVDDEQTEEVEQQESEQQEVKHKPVEREAVRVAREFFGPKDARAVYEIYLKELTSDRMRVIVSAVALGFLLVLSMITSFLGSFALFSDSPFVYSLVNFIVLIAVGAVNSKALADAFDRIKKKKFNQNTAIAASLIIGALQCIVSLGFGDLVLSGTHIYAAVALFPILLINIGEYTKTKNDIANFLLIKNEQDKLHTVKKIEDDGIAFEVGRGLMIKDPDIRYGSKVNFPYKFVEMSKSVDPTADIFKLVVPAAFLASVIVGIISALINKNVFVGITSLTGVFLMAMPAASVVSCYSVLKNINKKLNSESGMISGYEAVENTLEANAIVLDACDLFSNGEANIYGIKLFNSMRIDEAILYTAAVVIQSGGALTDVFDSIILSKREMLPTVDSLAYEERLGCSGWIYNYRVLVGNRELLAKHNVEVQSKEEESRFTSSGRQVVYLAVEGKVAAMFVVGYSADARAASYMRELERAGVSILVRTTDANITEELVEQYFGLPRNFIKVISPVAGLMYKEMSDVEAVNEPCRVLYNGKMNSFLRALTWSLRLNEQKKLISVLQYVGVAMGILLMAMFSFLSGLSQAGVLQIILFETLWALVVIFAPQLRKK